MAARAEGAFDDSDDEDGEEERDREKKETIGPRGTSVKTAPKHMQNVEYAQTPLLLATTTSGSAFLLEIDISNQALDSCLPLHIRSQSPRGPGQLMPFMEKVLVCKNSLLIRCKHIGCVCGWLVGRVHVFMDFSSLLPIACVFLFEFLHRFWISLIPVSSSSCLT